jgi:hypothetical protein
MEAIKECKLKIWYFYIIERAWFLIGVGGCMTCLFWGRLAIGKGSVYQHYYSLCLCTMTEYLLSRLLCKP